MKIAVLGAGNSGLATSAHLSRNNHSVYLWNRTSSNILKLSRIKKISIKGLYTEKVSIELASSNIEEIINDVSLIIVTIPANYHPQIAGLLSKYVTPDQHILLSPGRTFGAFEFTQNLLENGVNNLPKIAETQTILYTCRKTKEDEVLILDIKREVLISCIQPSDTLKFMESLPECISNSLIPAKSILETSIGNVGMILHCAPVLLNTGWIENKETRFKYYYAGITPTIASFLEKLDQERLEVAHKLNIKIDSIQKWFEKCYLIKEEKLYDCIQKNQSYKTIDAPVSLSHRYIYEDIATGLVPLEAIGKKLGLKMEICSLTINLANSLLDEDFRVIGRNLKKLNMDFTNIAG